MTIRLKLDLINTKPNGYFICRPEQLQKWR